MNKKIITIISSILLVSSCGLSLTNKWEFNTKNRFEKKYCSKMNTDEGFKECNCMINKVQTRYPDPIDFFALETDLTKRVEYLKYFRDDVEKGCLPDD